jgi:predicted nucleotidyltransferase
MTNLRLSSDFQEFLKLLELHGVKYLIVGGYAVALHGYPRSTGDFDVFIEQSNENGIKVLKAIDDYGFDITDFAKLDFEEEPVAFFMGQPPDKIDVISKISGVDFKDAYAHRIEIDINGLIVPFISLDDLKVNKKESGRLKDLNDLEHLP